MNSHQINDTYDNSYFYTVHENYIKYMKRRRLNWKSATKIVAQKSGQMEQLATENAGYWTTTVNAHILTKQMN